MSERDSAESAPNGLDPGDVAKLDAVPPQAPNVYGATGYWTPGYRGTPYAPPPPGYPAAPGYPAGYPPQAYPPSSWPAPYGPAGWGYAVAPASPFGPGYAPGGVGRRFAALIIDAVLVGTTILVPGALISLSGGSSREATPVAMAVMLLWLFFVLSYHPASWYVFDSTLGQRALGLSVRRMSDGQSLGFGAVTIRYIVFCMETLIVPLGIIAAVMAVNDPLKRTWHDEAGESVVVRVL